MTDEAQRTTIYHITSRGGWVQDLANLLDTAQNDDVIVVGDSAMMDLANNALQRRQEHKYLRVMTEERYAELTKLYSDEEKKYDVDLG